MQEFCDKRRTGRNADAPANQVSKQLDTGLIDESDGLKIDSQAAAIGCVLVAGAAEFIDPRTQQFAFELQGRMRVLSKQAGNPEHAFPRSQ
jgi:hypothetical protein